MNRYAPNQARLWGIVFIVSSLVAGVGFLAQTVVAQTAARNLAQPFAANWQPGPWNSATGSIRWVEGDQPQPERPQPVMEISVHYSGSGFQFFSAEPSGLKIPGRLERVRVWVKPMQADYTWLITFRDAEGKDSVDGKKLEWALNAAPGRWSLLEFTIPSNWKQPVRIVGISAHNWNRQQVAADAMLRICNLQVEVAIGDAPLADRPLGLRVVSDAPRNVFLENETVNFRIICNSWKAQQLSGKLLAEIVDVEGKSVAQWKEDLLLEDLYVKVISYQPSRFGPYRIRVVTQFNELPALQAEVRFIYVPKPHELSAEEKWACPWGLNIHSASGGVSYESLSRLGVVWVRDYSYNRQWLVAARGTDGHYGGWPWYPRINKGIQESGLMLLACMGESIAPYVQKGAIEPERQWKYDLVHILWAMPDFPAWELDNEYDYHHGNEENSRQWRAYHAYHRLFGEIVKLMKPHSLAVEQGTAGVHPEWVERSIKAGAFDKIDVVNAHFYCGIAPPELSIENANGPGEETTEMLLADRLRAFARAADCDGHDRQAWITEFGWDTRAGYVVTEDEQASYLQRGYLLGLACNIDKMFWFWDWDNKELATNYFDGCGLFDHRNEPKPAAAALAGLTHFLRNPRVLGTFDLDSGVVGYVIRDGNQLLACVFRPEKNASAVEIELPGQEFFDVYGNPLVGNRQQVGTAPIWIRGIAEDNPVVLETAFSWETPQLVPAIEEEPVRLVWSVKNDCGKELKGNWQLEAPREWELEAETGDFIVNPGEKQTFPISVRIPTVSQGEQKALRVVVRSGDAQKVLAAYLRVVPLANVTVQPIRILGEEASVVVRIRNNSLRQQSWLLRPNLPAGWSVRPASMPITLGPRSESEYRLLVNVGSKELPQSPPRLALTGQDGSVITEATMIVPFWNLAEINGIKVDGKFDDWPSHAWLPNWLLGVRGEIIPARLALGYNRFGIFLAIQVEKHGGQVTDPRVFWAQTCVELFLDTDDDPKPRNSYKLTDHQFWFCPLLDSGKVYAGRWKRGAEIAETQYGLEDVEGASRKTENGWAMEIFLPRGRLPSWNPTRGGRLGLNVNITLPGSATQTELFWPTAKSDRAPDQPELWGRVRLN